MAAWELIPTCPDPMSDYTLIALCIMGSGMIAAIGLLIRWNLREIDMLKEALGQHDDYIDDTAKIINQMSTDIAVTKESIQNIEDDVRETKTAITAINATLLDKLSK